MGRGRTDLLGGRTAPGHRSHRAVRRAVVDGSAAAGAGCGPTPGGVGAARHVPGGGARGCPGGCDDPADTIPRGVRCVPVSDRGLRARAADSRRVGGPRQSHEHPGLARGGAVGHLRDSRTGISAGARDRTRLRRGGRSHRLLGCADGPDGPMVLGDGEGQLYPSAFRATAGRRGRQPCRVVVGRPGRRRGGFGSSAAGSRDAALPMGWGRAVRRVPVTHGVQRAGVRPGGRRRLPPRRARGCLAR